MFQNTAGDRAGRGDLEGIQAGRGIAAAMVVLFHINTFALPERFYDGAASWAGFNMGYAGVEFFFVLSGFIMVFAHRRDFGLPARLQGFLVKRFVRIYPIYWIIFGALTLGYLAVPGFGPPQSRDPGAILASWFLWPTPDYPIMQVAWTLRHELLFYLLFAIVILHRSAGIAVLAAWSGACLLAGLTGDQTFPWSFLLSPYNVLFVMGIGAAVVHAGLRPAPALAALLVGGGLFLFVGLTEAFHLVAWAKAPRTLAYGLGAAAMVAGLAAGSLKIPRWLGFLGDASYSIYLAHMPALGVAAAILRKAGAPWGLPPIVLVVGLLAIAIVAGAVVHIAIERPVLRYLRRPGHLWNPPGRKPVEPTSQPASQ